jgi:hypothetical protein
MKVKFSGRVRFANGDPVPNVVVRIFDKDAAGKQDDDLTLTPGLSDEKGRFNLTYEPLRFLDYHTIPLPGALGDAFNTPSPEPGIKLPDLGDIYLPYLDFNYTFNGLNRHHTAALGIFKSDYYLPENPPVEFRPSRHGFRFTNQFRGYFLPFSTPAFVGSKKVPSIYGLCGGMCSAAYDFALSGRLVPHGERIPRQGSRLQRYLFRRQIDSLGEMGKQVVRVAQWSSMPDDGIAGAQARTLVEFDHVRQKLDDQNPCILALIYARATSLRELTKLIFTNHQVLAYGYHQDQDRTIMISVYDPNFPGRDDITLRCEPVLVGEVKARKGVREVFGLKTLQLVGGEAFRAVRGFFSMPYDPIRPPRGV